MDYPLESIFVETNGIRLHVMQAGPADGTVLLLLHGFPEFWYSWKRQIPFFAEKGYRVWAPDLRGYNKSDKPRGIRAYRMNHLTADVVGLIEATGAKKVILVGHDWGGFLAWHVAEQYPHLVEKLIICNVPLMPVMQRNLRRNPLQMMRSSYILFFQLPWIPEWSARVSDWKLLVGVMRGSSREGTFTDGDFERYREAWSQPGAYPSMLNWYRAFVQLKRKKSASERIKPPVLLLWGKQDAFLGANMAEESIVLCDEGRLVYFENATHWIQHEEAERVNELIFEFLGKGEKDEGVIGVGLGDGAVIGAHDQLQ
ncbi:alpha/beta fold hydrolase [Ammoniphilus sp. YIM 78166]|uniref:alpha/beta fold hydrolase n=1 Tax=Ammoniphilus sp. YIM 78166 TaxID=1644106 RepID=UPI001F11918A|nr:alpha/beta hydrolase [Ammoniphilus sp. YIM 78166]